MKWIFYVIVFIYMFYRAVYGKIPPPAFHKVTREPTFDLVDHGKKGDYFEPGKRVTIPCKGAGKNQKVEWVNPDGEVVPRDVTQRVYAQEHFMVAHKNRIPALLLVLNRATVEDTGVWECRAGDTVKESVTLCVIDPSEFVNAVQDVTVDVGRSITLSCQAKGDPEPRLIWSRDVKDGSIPISDDLDSSKYKLMTQYHSRGFAGLLTILSVDSDDSGVYHCEAFQVAPNVEECYAWIRMNITLHVNHAPKFAGGNETEIVPGQENTSVDLVCAADAHPTPTYRWFKENENGDVLTEYPDDRIMLRNNGKEAVLTVTANSTTFGQKFMCRAANKYGSMDKYFALIYLEEPRKPDEIILEGATDENLFFNASWNGEVLFPVDEIIVQYIKKDSLRKKSIPREVDWKRAKQVDIKTEEDVINGETSGVLVMLPDLEEKTDYWIRMRAVNEAGTSPWSKPIAASTIEKSEGDEEVEEATEEGDGSEETPTASALSDSTFYGVFFAGGIIVTAVGCMVIMRMV